MADIDTECFWFGTCEEEPTTPDPEPIIEPTTPVVDPLGFGLTVLPEFWNHPVGANLAFLTVATFQATLSGMRIFRWRKTVTGQDSYYKLWTSAGLTTPNYYELAFMILDYGRVGLYGIAWITQLIATFGALSSFNRIWWLYGIILLGSLLDGAFSVFILLGLEQAHAKNTTVGMTLVLQLVTEWMKFAAGNAITMSMMAIGYESWTYAAMEKAGENGVFVPPLQETFYF